jgi:phage terminase small subunit
MFTDVASDSTQLVETKKALKRPLTPKQQMFVAEYLIDLNGTQAAIRAGYSAKTAYSIAEEILRKPEIVDAIQAGMDRRAKKINLTGEDILANIARLAQKAEDMDDTSNALRANELLGKHLKLFTDKIEIDVGGELAQRIKEARERSIRR